MTGWKNVALGAFIMVAFVAFVILAFETFYKGPKSEDFFTPPPQVAVDTKETCETYGGKWNEYGVDSGRKPYPPEPARPDLVPNNDVIVPAPTGWCDVGFYAKQKWDAVRATHDRNAAIFVGVVSVLAFVVGIGLVRILPRLPLSVGGGLAFGGIVLSVYSLLRYWENTNEYIRLGVIGIILIFLIVLAWRYSKDGSREKSDSP